MSQVLATRTGSLRDRHPVPPDPTHTAIVYASVDDPVLRDELPKWDYSLHRDGFTFTALVGSFTTQELLAERVNAHELGAYEAVNWIADQLALPSTVVAAATGIKQRTYFSWASGAVKPRLASQGHLWRLLSVCEDLLALLGDGLKHWMKAHPDLRVNLDTGDYDALLAIAILEHGSVQSREIGPSLGIGDDSIPPSVAPRWTPVRRRAARGKSTK